MSRRTRGNGRIAGRPWRLARHAPALLAALAPKCPLCLLPLAAAAGVALPSQPALDLLVAGAAAGWLAIVLSTARWLPVRVAATAAAGLLLMGRFLDRPSASALGGALVLAVVVWTARARRPCRGTACVTAPPEVVR